MMDDKTLATLIQQLSLEEKASLCSGADSWTTKPLVQHGIPSLRMADGPHGVRYEDRRNHKENGGYSKPATCFPSETTLAASWNPALAKQVGDAVAQECLHYQVGMILGPGVNIKRSPLGGRNFEYYSEDPLLAGEMAAGWILGVQQNGVATSLKHYAVNNQEKNRMSISSVIDDRALFDLYLKPFEIAVRKSSPATLMASYNRVNGVFACENKRLLTDILRLRFGFTGAVVSDWGAIYNRPKGIAAGLDLEMPGSGGVCDDAIVQAVKNGELSEDLLDTACWNILRLVFQYNRENKPVPQCDFAAHHKLAVDALAQSTVLLKNDQLLPLEPSSRIAVIGEMAKTPRYQGGGSSIMNPKNLVGFTQALDQAGIQYNYAPGYYNGIHTDSAKLQQAAETAKQADVVVLFAGLPDVMECEGYDREHLALPHAQLRLMEVLEKANPNIVVVLCSGSPLECRWLPKAKAVLYPALGGEGIGPAMLRLLYGQDNPSGKLAESWPIRLADTPAYHHFPMGHQLVSYNESIFCGYRYYDTAQKEVQFPFGFGLSYTTFRYDEMRLSASSLKAGQTLMISCVVTNTGKFDGEETVQLYLQRIGSAMPQPAQELKGFAKIMLKAGQSKQVELQLSHHELGFYDPLSQSHLVESGSYCLRIGSNSRNLPLSQMLQAEGITPQHRLTEAQAQAFEFYHNIQDNRFPTRHFEGLYGRTVPKNIPAAKGRYTDITTLGEMKDSWWGRRLLGLATFISRRAIRFSAEKEANDHVARQLAHDMPFKNIVLNSSGLISPQASDELLAVCNRKGSFFRFLRLLLKKRSYALKKQTKR